MDRPAPQTPPTPGQAPVASVEYATLTAAEHGHADRAWWDANADEYLDDHGAFLGDADFRWCPEGLREEDAGFLGDVAGRRVLEIGAGAAQCSRWLRGRGADVVATDVSTGMLDQARVLNHRTGVHVPLLAADARELPLDDDSFDVVFTSFGAIPFVPDAHRIHREAARVLRPGGTWTLSVTHPARWMFPDDPSEHGLGVIRSYFDRRPYVERDRAGHVLYAEFHRTLGDHVRDVVAAGFELFDIVEPEWPADNASVWGGWGPVRGALVPGTAILRCRLPAERGHGPRRP